MACCPPPGDVAAPPVQPLFSLCGGMSGCCSVQEDRSTPKPVTSQALAKSPASMRHAAVAAQPPPFQARRALAGASPYAKPVFELKTDLRI